MESQMRQLLIVEDGPGQGESYELQDMVCTVGRTHDNHIVIESQRISRRHAQIKILPNGTVLEDMGSTNGTWVNEQRLSGPHRLVHGDVVRFADYITFRYFIEDTVKTEKLAPDASGQGVQTVAFTPSGHAQTPAPPSPAPAVSFLSEEGYSAASSEPYVQAPSYEADAMVAPYEQVAPLSIEDQESAPRRPLLVYLGMGALVLAIFACLGLAVYLWFAPETFWFWFFETFSIQVP